MAFAVIPLQLNQTLVRKFCPCLGQEQQPRQGNCKSLKLRGKKQSKAQNAAGWVCRVLTEGWVLLASAPCVPWHCSELCWDSSGVDSASRNCCPSPSSPLQSAVTSSLLSCGCYRSTGEVWLCGSRLCFCAGLCKHVLSFGCPHLKPGLWPVLRASMSLVVVTDGCGWPQLSTGKVPGKGCPCSAVNWLLGWLYQAVKITVLPSLPSSLISGYEWVWAGNCCCSQPVLFAFVCRSIQVSQWGQEHWCWQEGQW